MIESILKGLNKRAADELLAIYFAGAKGEALQLGLQNDERMKCGQRADKNRTIVIYCKSSI
jgi:hypothetical protein